jgi:hypothetical protein
MTALNELFTPIQEMPMASQLFSVCTRCGALVDEMRRVQHSVWHAALERNGAERPEREDYSEG